MGIRHITLQLVGRIRAGRRAENTTGAPTNPLREGDLQTGSSGPPRASRLKYQGFGRDMWRDAGRTPDKGMPGDSKLSFEGLDIMCNVSNDV